MDSENNIEWKESEIILISMVEHYSYCPRQCALIHIEQIFDENIYTMRGHLLHRRIDEKKIRMENCIRIEQSLPLWSDRLGLIGKSDVVEFHHNGQVFPVEYKHGPRKQKQHDDLQLCAQALCLEEMLDITITQGAIFHHSSRRRREVCFTPELRCKVESIIKEIRKILSDEILPSPVADMRCDKCSLINLCMPYAVTEVHKSKKSINIFKPFPEKDNW
ncbi:CRISPR-associated protein Cas4 [candidate division KSB1 bacterium]